VSHLLTYASQVEYIIIVSLALALALALALTLALTLARISK
jgi:hypothetical protein